MYHLDLTYIQRLQNRKLRLKALYPDYQDDNNYLLGNVTPPNTTIDYELIETTKPLCNTASKLLLQQAIQKDISQTRDLEMGYDFEPFQCPICFETIWRDTYTFECFYCDKEICNLCYDKLKTTSQNNNTSLTCVLCRGVLIEYVKREPEEYALHRQNILYDENENEILDMDREQRERNTICTSKNIIKFILALLIFAGFMIIIFVE